MSDRKPDPTTYGSGRTQAPPTDEVHGAAHTPIGYGAQHVEDSQILFPDGQDHGWVLTIGGAVAYLTEQQADELGRLFLYGSTR